MSSGDEGLGFCKINLSKFIMMIILFVYIPGTYWLTINVHRGLLPIMIHI